MKYHGEIGFAMTEETVPGVWEPKIVPRSYKGDVISVKKRYVTADKINDDIDITNQISIIADPFISENFYNIRYVTFMGQRWKVTDINIEYPRITLSIGGIYNGESS